MSKKSCERCEVNKEIIAKSIIAGGNPLVRWGWSQGNCVCICYQCNCKFMGAKKKSNCCRKCATELELKRLHVAERHIKVTSKATFISIEEQHAYSLSVMVQWFKQMIQIRGVDTPELTAGYCDELLKDLSKKE